MTETAQPIIGVSSKLYIATSQATPPTIAAGVVTGGTAVGKIKTIKAPQPKFGTEDTTTLDTPVGTRTFIKTLQDPGDMDVNVLWESADPGQTAVLTAFNTQSNSANGAAFPFLLVLPTNLEGGQTTEGDAFAFSALVTDYSGPELQVDKTIAWSFKVKITGPITFTEGS
jgi:hypothetical protein